MSAERFAGRRVLVTGASRGIGAATAHRFAAEGADVAIVARTVAQHDHLAGSLSETAEGMRRFGGCVAVIAADIADEADRARIVREPRQVLADMGLDLDDDVEIRVWDSSSEVRYLVLPEQPDGTSDLSEEELAALVTRDAMVGVGRGTAP